jgi:phage gp36-like protein
MQRVDGWEIKLEDALQDAASKPYIMGKTDCFLSTANVVQSVTGEDIMADWRGDYKTLKEAARIIKAASYESAVHWLDNVTDGRVAASKARRGDIVATQTDRVIPSVGICAGDKAVIFVHDVGAVFVPMNTIEEAWRI